MTRNLGLAICPAVMTATPDLAAQRTHEDLRRQCTGDATPFGDEIGLDSTAMKLCFERRRKELSEN